MDEILGIFIEDAHDHLAAMESGLLRMEDGGGDAEALNAVFRAAHTIKGDAGVADLHRLERFTHVLEHYLDQLRKGRIGADKHLISLLLEGCDHIRTLLAQAAAEEPETDSRLDAEGEAIAGRLHALVAAETAPRHPWDDSGPARTLPPPEDAAVSSDATPRTGAPVGIRMPATKTRQVRVAADKLDLLVDMVGELVISNAAASMQAQMSGHGGLIEANAGVSRLVEGIRELSLRLRMVRIGETFDRFRRVVRDMGRDMGREIELVIRGDDTELDKAIVEKMGDSLLHLIRNALDHGIESPQARVAAGKPAQGRLELIACHENGGIVIEVADDGAGLDQERILAKAIDRGLVAPNQVLSAEEIANLIFEAGFSTADRVTNVSGRGVGMDVVRNTVQSLRGSIEVRSIRGQGTRFVIRLPLTMAIIDGFLVEAGDTAFVIPLGLVAECCEMPAGNDNRDFIDLRGEALPCLRLRDLFTLPGERPWRENVVVIRHGARKICLVVDRLRGELQTVIKPLSAVFRQLRGIAGATILGSGEVALILDLQGLLQLIDAPAEAR